MKEIRKENMRKWWKIRIVYSEKLTENYSE